MDKIIVLDFGSQYSHLICRRIREVNIYCELLPYNTQAKVLKELNPKGIIFSGGPASIYSKDSPKPDKDIFEMNIPILGICYGQQVLIDNFEGTVKRSNIREYGRAELVIDDKTDLFKNIGKNIKCWMSHGDAANKLPKGFKVIAHTDNSFSASIANQQKKFYGIQFHPEVGHTEKGIDILKNFSQNISMAKPDWNMENFIDIAIKDIRKHVKNEKVLCAVSGGIDSTTAATLLHRAIGDSLHCVFVNHGLLRKDEENLVNKLFKEHLGIQVIYVDVEKKNGPFRWLAQGTLYPDVIESGVSRGPAAIIKTHHNVGGLPKWLN